MHKLLKTTAIISFLTFLSRIFGLLRDALIAMLFGTSSISDAFFVAFRPFDLCRKLFSEGVVNVAFIPVFSRVMAQEGRARAVEAAFSFFYLLSFVSTVIIIAGGVLAPWIIKIVAPGFGDDPATYDLTLVMFRIMLPYVLLIVMTAVCIAVLNSLKEFAFPAASPVILNLVIISFALWVCPRLDNPVLGVAFGVTAGGIAQLAVQIFIVAKAGIFKGFLVRLKNTYALKMLKTVLPCMVGAAAYQVNMVVASFFASNLEEGSVSSLYFADRLLQFPMALFTVSAATVLLPEMSHKASENRFDRIGHVFEDGFKLILFVTIPAMAGLLALDQQIVALLFGRGEFDQAAVVQTAQCTFYLVSGLWVFTCTRFFVTLHFSIQSIKIPFYAGMISIIFNLAGAYLWMKFFGLNGLVFSMVFSALCAWIFLLFNPPAAVKLNARQILVSACRSVFLSVIMFVLVKVMARWIPPWQTGGAAFISMTLACILFGVLFYFGINYWMSSPEFRLIFNRERQSK